MWRIVANVVGLFWHEERIPLSLVFLMATRRGQVLPAMWNFPKSPDGFPTTRELVFRLFHFIDKRQWLRPATRGWRLTLFFQQAEH
jgi:hypothetical protein